MTLSDSSVLTDSVSLCGGESDKGLSGSTGQGALLRSRLLLWLCRGEVTGHLIELDGISGSSGAVSLNWSWRGAVS